jgi:hypothetical protein
MARKRRKGRMFTREQRAERREAVEAHDQEIGPEAVQARRDRELLAGYAPAMFDSAPMVAEAWLSALEWSDDPELAVELAALGRVYRRMTQRELTVGEAEGLIEAHAEESYALGVADRARREAVGLGMSPAELGAYVEDAVEAAEIGALLAEEPER